MKPNLKNFLVPTASAVAGGIIVLGALKLNPVFASKINSTDYRNQNSEIIYDNIMRHRNGINDSFDDLFKDNFFGGGSGNDIAKREDDNFVYYDVKIDDVKSTSIDTKIENGYITITGTTEKKSATADGDENERNQFSAQSIYKSTFNRTFPLPDYVDQDKMQMAPEKDKVVLKFPKLKA